MFDKNLRRYSRYYLFKQFNEKYYNIFGFFTSFYKKGVRYMHSNTNVKIIVNY